MAMSSVSPASSNVIQQQQAATVARQSAPKPAERPSESEVAAKAKESQMRTQQAQTQQAQRTETQRSEAQTPRRAEQPKPVVNAQGQKLGSIINESA